MSEERTYCVYKHTAPNGKVYVGITGRDPEKRWNYGHGYDTQFFGKAVKKYGWENIKHEILKSGLTADEAFEAEIEAIREFNSRDPMHGYNCDEGGKGASGWTATPELRKQCSEHAKKMWANKEIREKLLKHLAELGEQSRGRAKAKEATAKTAEALSKKVVQYSKNGEYIKTFNSLMDAARSVGVESNSAIVACAQGKKKTIYGYIWKYEGDELTEEELLTRTTTVRKRTTPIAMTDDNGNVIETFEGFHDAWKKTGISYKAIFSACKTGRRCGGFRWKYISGT